MDEEVDVLVIGAGPAGSEAARSAAEGGASTLLIEKRAEIGTPVRCGEGVGKRWLVETGIPASRDFIAHEIRASRIVSPDGSSFVVEDHGGGKGGFILERDRFDRFLAKRAASAGARIRVRTSAIGLLREGGRVTGARCEHMGETFDVRARVVIGADGFESQVGRWGGLTTHLRARDVASCLQYTLVGIEGEPEYAEFHLGSMAPGGYLWVFWKGEDTANVGLGVPVSKLRDRADTKRYLDAFIARSPGLARGEIVEEVAGGVSMSLPVERSVGDGLLLSGDAARLIDPLTGAGIFNALLSGSYAGEVASAAVREGNPSSGFLNRYDRMWRGRIEEELARHYLIKEGLQRTDDESLNRIIRAVADAKPAQVTAKVILGIVKERCPEALRPFARLLES